MLDKIEKYSIDIIISDYQMPKMDGKELTQKIKQDYPDIKVVVISGSSVSEQEALEWGAAAFLIKPFKTSDLISILASIK